jgi:drug/metabolite transporter (DMT)-like permease
VKTNMPMVWLFLLIDVMVSSFGSVATKRALAGGGAKWVVVAMLIYSLANVTWMGTLRSGGGQLARMGVLSDLTNCLAAVALGILVYREAMTVRHGVGLVVAMVGIVLLGGE